MIKGSQRQLIVLRTGDSRYFDEAYFVLRREIGADRTCRTDILREANRILESNIPRGRRNHRERVRGFLWFWIGLCVGIALAVGVALLL